MGADGQTCAECLASGSHQRLQRTNRNEHCFASTARFIHEADAGKWQANEALLKAILYGSVRTVNRFAFNLQSEELVSRFKVTSSKEIHTMDAITKSVLAIAFAIAAFLLLLFGGAKTTGIMM